MNSRTNETHHTLAAATVDKKPNIDALLELANLLDYPAAFKRFAGRWPDLGPLADRPADEEPTGASYTVPNTVYTGYPYGEPPTRMPANLPKEFLLIWQRREVLRQIWKGNSEKLTAVLFGNPIEAEYFPDPEWPWPPQLKVDWQRGEFVYVPRTEFQTAVYAVFRKSAYAKVCANPDCVATPFFIARRTSQRYCSDKCAEVFQRAYKLQWWKKHGSERRRKRSRGKRGKR